MRAMCAIDDSDNTGVPMAALVVVVALLLVSVSAAAIPAAEINPDRPEVTESAKLVPRGAVQPHPPESAPDVKR